MCLIKEATCSRLACRRSLGAAELGGVLLDQASIRTVLANQQAELVAEFGFAIAADRPGRQLPCIRLGLAASGQGSDLLDRADPNPVGLTQGRLNS